MNFWRRTCLCFIPKPCGDGSTAGHASSVLKQRYALLKQARPQKCLQCRLSAWRCSCIIGYVRSTVQHHENETSSRNNWILVISKSRNLFLKLRSCFHATTAIRISYTGRGAEDGQRAIELQRWTHLEGGSSLEMSCASRLPVPFHW